MKEIFKDFTKKIIIREDLIFSLEEISLAQGLIFKDTHIPLSEKVKGKVGEDFRKCLESLEKEKIISKVPEKNQIFFENLKKYLQNLPQIKMEIAFQPKREFLKEISSWVEKESKQKVVLDLIFNPEIIGGAIIEYQGRYFDFSLAKKVDELISKKSL